MLSFYVVGYNNQSELNLGSLASQVRLKVEQVKLEKTVHYVAVVNVTPYEQDKIMF